jgi:glycosyltransferase involved in cell wall biosynthesis
MAAFKHTAADLPPYAAPRVVSMPEVGVDPALFDSSVRSPAGTALTFLFAGRLVPCKLPWVPVEAFARSAKLRQHKLILVGDGPERGDIERRISQNNLQSCVQLVGWKPQSDVAAMMKSADVFVFPSIRELGAGVVAEAMASGMCVVVVDYGGPGGLVTNNRGIKVPMGDAESILEKYILHMEALITDRGRIAALGTEARHYALRHLTWDAKARRTVEVYEWAMERRKEPPAEPT